METSFPAKPLACSMDYYLEPYLWCKEFLKLIWDERGGGVNSIKLSCYRGSVILDIF